jgi:leucine dehydrogenase
MSMEVFNSLAQDQHEQVVFCSDRVSGLRSIIAIHDTTLGPAIGGVRMFPYESEKEALEDVLRQSKAMTYKSAAAGINLGGGQGVIIGDPQRDKNELILRAFGKCVNGLNGRYITAEDVGTTVEDMEIVRYETRWVTGLSEALGGGGDPGSVSAIGVKHGLLACVQEVLGKNNLKGVSVVIQGLGNVGMYLAQILHKDGCKLFVADIVSSKAEKAKEDFKAEIVPPDEVYQVKADVFSPCALGGIINDDTVEKLKVKIVAGAANNQLAEERHGEILQKRNIFYAPDFVIGAGGLINVVNELEGYRPERALKKAEGIYDLMKRVIEISKSEKLPTSAAANLLAENRILQVKRFKQRHA